MKRVIIADQEYDWEDLTDELKTMVQSIKSLDLELSREKQLLNSLNEARVLLIADLKRSILRKKSGI